MNTKQKIYLAISAIFFLNSFSTLAMVLPYKVKSVEGYNLFRDSDDHEVFYYLPRYFHVERNFQNEPFMSHVFYDRIQNPFSFYKFILKAVPPISSSKLKMENAIRLSTGVRNPRIEPAPIQDMYMKIPKITFGPIANAMSYTVQEWEEGDKLSVADIYQPISMEFYVDQSLEPGTANAMMQAGIAFPSIKIKLKGQFTPKRATLKYHQNMVHSYFGGSITATYKLFTASLSHEIEELKKNKSLVIDVECDLPDPTQNTACNEKLEESLLNLFKEMLFEEVLKPTTPTLGQPANIFGLVYRGKNMTDDEWVTIDIRHTVNNYFYYDVEPIIQHLPKHQFDSKVFNLTDRN